jgi:hypothetical protein
VALELGGEPSPPFPLLLLGTPLLLLLLLLLIPLFFSRPRVPLLEENGGADIPAMAERSDCRRDVVRDDSPEGLAAPALGPLPLFFFFLSFASSMELLWDAAALSSSPPSSPLEVVATRKLFLSTAAGMDPNKTNR